MQFPTLSISQSSVSVAVMIALQGVATDKVSLIAYTTYWWDETSQPSVVSVFCVLPNPPVCPGRSRSRPPNDGPPLPPRPLHTKNPSGTA